MKAITRLAATTAALCLAGSVALALQQDPAETGKKVADELRSAMQDPGAMQRWQETTRPGPAHEFLTQAFVGEWETQMKMWMDPQGEPMTSKGSATVEELFDGRYIRETFKGEFMGQAFEGHSITGFDNNKKLFVTSWIDSMSTGIMEMKGSVSPDGKRLTFIGEMDEPMSGEMGKAFKLVITVDSADEHTMEMFEILYGDPIRMMEVRYTRTGDGDAGDGE